MNHEAGITAMIAEVMVPNAGRQRGRRVFLFGSRASAEASPHSDFDVGVMGDEPLPLDDLDAIEDQLDALPTLHKIDWVELNRASRRFREHPLQQTKTLYG